MTLSFWICTVWYHKALTRSEWPVAEARSFPFLQSQMQTVFFASNPTEANRLIKEKNEERIV